MNDWRKLFKRWAKRGDFIEVHPQIFQDVLNEVAQLEATIVRLQKALDGVPEAIPNTWLDPLLTGPNKLFEHDEPEGSVKRILMEVRRRLRGYVDYTMKILRAMWLVALHGHVPGKTYWDGHDLRSTCRICEKPIFLSRYGVWF